MLGKNRLTNSQLKDFYDFFSPFLLSKFFSPPYIFSPQIPPNSPFKKKNHNKYIKQNQTELGWHTKIYTVIPQVYKKNLQKNKICRS